MKVLLLSAIVVSIISCSHSQDSIVASQVKADNPLELLDSLGIDHEVARDSRFRFQFVYTPVSNGEIDTMYAFNTDAYYYPASLVKFLAAAVLLEVLIEKDIPLDATPVFDTVNACGSTRFVELSKQKITFKQILTELMVVSDNHFYNLLYHFITPEVLNNKLKAKGARNTKIYRAFTGCSKLDQLHTYPFKVIDDKGEIIYKQAETWLDTNTISQLYTETPERMFGSKHENAEGDIVSGPYDLNFNIEIPLEDIHLLFTKFLYPFKLKGEQWNLPAEKMKFLKEIMILYTNEISSSYRSLKHLTPDVYKFASAIPGDMEVRTISKLGLSYGFASEIAYIEIPGTHEGMILSYSVYVNENDVVNDGEYEYEEVARPFAESLVTDLIEWQLSQH